MATLTYPIANHGIYSLGIMVTACWLWYWYLRPVRAVAGWPVINPRDTWDVFSAQMKRRFIEKAPELLDEGFSQSPDGFVIMSFDGPKLVLSPNLADEIKDDPRLSFFEANLRNLPGHIRCLQPVSPTRPKMEILRNCIVKLTRSLALLTRPLSEEASSAIMDSWTDNPDWHLIDLEREAQKMVVRVSGRAFLGEELCSDPRWADIVLGYSDAMIETVYNLKAVPRLLHPLLGLHPACRKAQSYIAAAECLLRPIIEKRRGDGEPATDAIGWMNQAAGGTDHDPVQAQIGLAFIATHTTIDTITKAVIHLAKNPDVVRQLRIEIIAAVERHQFTKAGISQMHLLDSFLKESQRIDPMTLATMNRVAQDDIALSNNSRIPRGTHVVVSTHGRMDPSVYPDPGTFKADRFLKVQNQSGDQSLNNYTTTSAHSMGFGHGVDSCPGRFFVALEMKIIICHLVLKYDFKLPPDVSRASFMSGFFCFSSRDLQLLVRRRREEVSL